MQNRIKASGAARKKLTKEKKNGHKKK